MKKSKLTLIVALLYLLVFIAILGYLAWSFNTSEDSLVKSMILPINCIITGGFGGCLYCLRGIYNNYSVRNQWDDRWLVWYFVRPLTSMICGGISFIFLKAGLLVLEAKKEEEATNLGFFALAVIAGLNVDRFIAKIEDLAKSTWGIEKSRSSSAANTEDPATPPTQ